MKKPEMQVILREVGWSQAEFARRIGVDPVTVSRWEVVPSPAAAYLRLYLRVRGVLE